LILNLIANAVDAIGRGGTLKIRIAIHTNAGMDRGPVFA
jgi:signal transduction histidine kinase